MHICIIGTGYVGLVTGVCFSEFGVNVISVDKDENKISNLKKGILPIYEPGLEDMVKRNQQSERLEFSTDLADAVRRSLIIFIAVGTPPGQDGSADLSSVEEVARQVGECMDEYKVIVNKSTVPVGTGERVRKIISENLITDTTFDVVSNPEFLREGSAIEDFMRPNRVVLGVSSDQARAIMKELYRPLYLLETPIVFTNIRTAEMIKYAANAFLATKISFINEMANLCDAAGANVTDVAIGMGLDQRIGKKFLHPGPGYGGSCFPKDTRALLKIAEEHGYQFDIVKAVIGVNERQKQWAASKIKKMLGSFDGKPIAVLGLSFKPNTDDVRESPVICIINDLMADGAVIQAFDPIAMDNAKSEIIGSNITYCKNQNEAIQGASAVIVAVEWNQFRNLPLDELREQMAEPNFIDLKNIYEPAHLIKHGFNYLGIGNNA